MSKNVSGVVVYTNPKFLNSVLEAIKNSGVCDVHFHDEKGRIVITIEGENTEEEISKLKVIQAIPYVISAQMHFTFMEDELDKAVRDIEKNEDALIEFLNSENIPAENIRYSGHLKDI